MKVFIVTSGEYSDYGIRAVFTDYEKAELYCATHNKKSSTDICCIEEYDTEDFKIESNETPKEVWCFTTSNENIKASKQYLTFDNIEFCCRRSSGYYGEVTVKKNTPEEKVIKIAADRIAKFKAEQILKLQEE